MTEAERRANVVQIRMERAEVAVDSWETRTRYAERLVDELETANHLRVQERDTARAEIVRLRAECDRLCVMLAHHAGDLDIETARRAANLPYGVHPTWAEARDQYIARGRELADKSA